MYAIDGGSLKDVSVKDTMNTKVEWKMNVPTANRRDSFWLLRNTAYPPDSETPKLFDFDAAAETQTSVYFKPQPFSALAVYIVNAVSGSSVVDFVVWGGWDDSTQTVVGDAIQGVNVIGDAPIDTIAVTSHLQASVPAELIGDVNGLPIYDWIWVVGTAGTACGFNQQYMLKFGYSKE